MKIKIAKSEVIHFIGIGGIGMSGLALVMKRMGFKVILFLVVLFILAYISKQQIWRDVKY